MYQITVITARQNTDTVFWPQSENIRAIIQECRTSGSLVNDELSISEDGLTRTYTATWITKEKYLEFIDNEVVSEERWNRKMYNNKNNIVMSTTEAKEI